MIVGGRSFLFAAWIFRGEMLNFRGVSGVTMKMRHERYFVHKIWFYFSVWLGWYPSLSHYTSPTKKKLQEILPKNGPYLLESITSPNFFNVLRSQLWTTTTCKGIFFLKSSNWLGGIQRSIQGPLKQSLSFFRNGLAKETTHDLQIKSNLKSLPSNEEIPLFWNLLLPVTSNNQCSMNAWLNNHFPWEDVVHHPIDSQPSQPFNFNGSPSGSRFICVFRATRQTPHLLDKAGLSTSYPQQTADLKGFYENHHHHHPLRLAMKSVFFFLGGKNVALGGWTP